MRGMAIDVAFNFRTDTTALIPIATRRHGRAYSSVLPVASPAPVASTQMLSWMSISCLASAWHSAQMKMSPE